MKGLCFIGLGLVGLSVMVFFVIVVVLDEVFVELVVELI